MIEDLLTRRVNFLLGKNGCGKSTLLRQLEGRLANDQEWFVSYVTPERGGSLTYDAGLEQNLLTQADWGRSVRRKNRFDQFRQQSFSQFRTLEMLVLREIEKNDTLRNDHSYTFDTLVDQVNELLPLVRLSRSITGSGFSILAKSTGKKIEATGISSGESEAIALAIEALVFARECQQRPKRLLLLDEPDVHLHPDLQSKYMRFLEALAAERDFKVLIATHSTAMVGSLRSKDECQLAFMPTNQNAEIEFSPAHEIAQTVLPMFGAHPLSNLFNESPLLLLEGEDDKRVWDQAVRSSNGRLTIWPCPAGSKDEMTNWESWLIRTLPSLYDAPRAFSLRDRDTSAEELDDRPPIVRFRLGCRTAENLILTDESLDLTGTSWQQVAKRCEAWIEAYPGHQASSAMRDFIAGGFNRKGADLKALRNVLLAMLGTQKPWEVLAGQCIAHAINGGGGASEHSVKSYLGAKLCSELLGI